MCLLFATKAVCVCTRSCCVYQWSNRWLLTLPSLTGAPKLVSFDLFSPEVQWWIGPREVRHLCWGNSTSGKSARKVIVWLYSTELPSETLAAVVGADPTSRSNTPTRDTPRDMWCTLEVQRLLQLRSLNVCPECLRNNSLIQILNHKVLF